MIFLFLSIRFRRWRKASPRSVEPRRRPRSWGGPWGVVVWMAFLVALASCAHQGTAVKSSPAGSRKIVWNYNNGWFHTSDGRQSITEVARLYHRDPELVGLLNQVSFRDHPAAGVKLYIPPTNNRAQVRQVLTRIQGRPNSVPPVPWNYETGSPRGRGKVALKTPGASRKVLVARGRVEDERPPKKKVRTVRSNGRSKKPKRRSTEVVKDSGGTPQPKRPFRWPLKGEIVNPFKAGWTESPLHGLEIAAEEGTPIRAARAGMVLWANDLPGYGNLIIIDHLDGFASSYGYNKKLLVDTGDRVKVGQKIALVGRPTPHSRSKLFFEIHRNATPVDPMLYLN
jgi:murein DD-endopeptidase MepM/ murein hydrolase activator NlpD